MLTNFVSILFLSICNRIKENYNKKYNLTK